MKITTDFIKRLIKEEFQKWHEGENLQQLSKDYGHEVLSLLASTTKEGGFIAKRENLPSDTYKSRTTSDYHLAFLPKKTQMPDGKILESGFCIIEQSEAIEPRVIAGTFKTEIEALQYAVDYLENYYQTYPDAVVHYDTSVLDKIDFEQYRMKEPEKIREELTDLRRDDKKEAETDKIADKVVAKLSDDGAEDEETDEEKRLSTFPFSR